MADPVGVLHGPDPRSLLSESDRNARFDVGGGQEAGSHYPTGDVSTSLSLSLSLTYDR